MKYPNWLVLVPIVCATAAVAVSDPSSASELAPGRAVETAAHGEESVAHAELLRFLVQPVVDADEFKGKTVAILASDGVSAFELELTRDYFMGRGARVDVLAPRPVEGAPMFGLAGYAPPRERLTTLDYASERRLVAVTWYLDQVKPQNYDAIYVPNNLEDIERLGTNAQTIGFLVAAQNARRPVFTTGNGLTVVPGLGIATSAGRDSFSSPPREMGGLQWRIYAARDAFDMPRLITALAGTLTSGPDLRVD